MNHEGRRDATPEDIGRALRRYLIATGLLWLAVAAALAIARALS
jgi:hypothetical protein